MKKEIAIGKGELRIPAEAPAAALQRRPLGLILGAAWVSAVMAGGIDGESDENEKRILSGEGDGGGTGWSHGLGERHSLARFFD